MNPDIKAKWIAALRSGEYKQNTGYLRSLFGHCCLGVLCELHSKDTGAKWQRKANEWQYFGSAGILPNEVCEWAGLGDSKSGFMNDPYLNKVCLSTYNDDGETFYEIADIIEAYL